MKQFVECCAGIDIGKREMTVTILTGSVEVETIPQTGTSVAAEKTSVTHFRRLDVAPDTCGCVASISDCIASATAAYTITHASI